MQTDLSSATAGHTKPKSTLIEQAAESTRKLAWIQDYMNEWQTLRAVAARITQKQSMQKRHDEAAFEMLVKLMALCDSKLIIIEGAYVDKYSAHERLMIRLESEDNGND